MLPLKTSLNEQHSVICFLWAKGLGASAIHSEIQFRPGPSDCHLFGPMKRMRGVQKIASDTEVQSTVRQWLRKVVGKILHWLSVFSVQVTSQ